MYSCDFQPLPPAQLKRLLAATTTGDEEDKAVSSGSAGASAGAAGTGPVIAGGRQYRLATAGGDSKVRVSTLSPLVLQIAMLTFRPCLSSG